MRSKHWCRAAARESLQLNKIDLAGSRRLRSTLAAAPIRFTHNAVTVTKTKSIHHMHVHVRS